MSNIKQLKEARGSKLAELNRLTATIEAGTATPEERTSFDSVAKEIETITADLQRLENARSIAAGMGGGEGGGDGEEKELGKNNFSFQKLTRSIVNGSKLDGFEAEIVAQSANEARSLGISPEGIYLSNHLLQVNQRAMSAGSSTAGGNFIPTEKVGFFDALYAQTVLEGLGATKLTGLSSNTDLTGFSTGVTVGWATETADGSSGDPVTASRSITPKRLTAYIDISKQLMIQTNDSIEQFTQASFLRALAVAVEAAAINGSGSAGQPTGLLGTSGIGSVAIGTNGGAPTLAKILEIVQVNQSANAGDFGKWLTNPKVVAKLKQTSIDAGSGAMIMSYGPYFGGVAQQINGYEVYSTSNVPSNLDKGTTTGVCSALIYGVWDNLVVGQYGGIDVTIDPYSQAIGGKLRLVMNQYVGIAVKQPAAFTACKDLTTT